MLTCSAYSYMEFSRANTEALLITIAITTFNRCEIVERAIRSALSFAAMIEARVVIIDDASTDNTDSMIKSLFAGQLANGMVTLVRLDTNRGVTAAKNTAFKLADADWVIFLDSDDELIPRTGYPVQQYLAMHRNSPVVFFRCMNERNAFVGRSFEEPQKLDLQRYIARTSYGESLVAINKQIDTNSPFDADLRGYEGLGCARLIKKHGPALLSTIVARRYNRSRRDRLSRPTGILRRAHLLAMGHLRYVAICGGDMTRHQRNALRAKALAYALLGKLCRLLYAHD